MGEKVASLAAEEPVQILQMSTTFGKCRLALCEGRAFPVSAQDCFQHLHDQLPQAAWNMCVMLAAQVDLLPSAARCQTLLTPLVVLPQQLCGYLPWQ